MADECEHDIKSWFAGICTECGFNIVITQPDPLKHFFADYWWYCSNKKCIYHDPGEATSDMDRPIWARQYEKKYAQPDNYFHPIINLATAKRCLAIARYTRESEKIIKIIKDKIKFYEMVERLKEGWQKWKDIGVIRDFKIEEGPGENVITTSIKPVHPMEYVSVQIGKPDYMSDEKWEEVMERIAQENWEEILIKDKKDDQ